MTDIIHFPIPDKQSSDLEKVINDALQLIPKKDREKLRFELVKTVDSYDDCFTQWPLSLDENDSEALKKQIYDIAHQEHENKMRMLDDIVKLKVKVLVAEYFQ